MNPQTRPVTDATRCSGEPLAAFATKGVNVGPPHTLSRQSLQCSGIVVVDIDVSRRSSKSSSTTSLDRIVASTYIDWAVDQRPNRAITVIDREPEPTI